MLERDMTKKSVSYFSMQSNVVCVVEEVPFLSRCIDVVMITKDDELISIEFKINKWRHAIEQAVNHKLGADKAYICLPKRKISSELMSSLKEAGVGLMFFENDKEKPIQTVVEVEPGKENIPALREMLIKNVKQVEASF